MNSQENRLGDGALYFELFYGLVLEFARKWPNRGLAEKALRVLWMFAPEWLKESEVRRVAAVMGMTEGQAAEICDVIAVLLAAEFRRCGLPVPGWESVGETQFQVPGERFRLADSKWAYELSPSILSHVAGRAAHSARASRVTAGEDRREITARLRRQARMANGGRAA